MGQSKQRTFVQQLSRRLQPYWWLWLLAVALGFKAVFWTADSFSASQKDKAMPITQACLETLRKHYGDSPHLSQPGIEEIKFEDRVTGQPQKWSLSGWLFYGSDKEVFDCNGLMTPAGHIQVTYAFGSPWWTLPPW